MNEEKKASKKICHKGKQGEQRQPCQIKVAENCRAEHEEERKLIEQKIGKKYKPKV